jgi:hypothetical protein
MEHQSEILFSKRQPGTDFDNPDKEEGGGHFSSQETES